jgi:hypothetical protein
VQPSSERTVDYTVPFGESSGVFEKGFTLTADDFGPAPQSTIDQLNQAGIKFFQVKQKASALDGKVNQGDILFDSLSVGHRLK